MTDGKKDQSPDDWGDDLQYADPQEGRDGPPDGWDQPSWLNRDTGMFYWNGKKDPCPVTPMGHDDGFYYFVTASGEYRKFTSGQLHGRGGPPDLFAGARWWPMKHFRRWDKTDKKLTGGLQMQRCMGTMIDLCVAKGKIDGSVQHRSVGTWRGPEGQPIVHAGDQIFCDGQLLGPGAMLGDILYVVGGKRARPAHSVDDRDDDLFEWDPADVMHCHRIVGHLDEWHWQDAESRDLFLGGLWCDMLGDVPLWKPHKFVRAPAGSGKSTLLKYVRALLGGAAHGVFRTYSKARLEERCSHSSLAILLDEAERGDGRGDGDRIRGIFNLVLLLSDEGATGGRFQREIDVHGTVTMVATLTDEHRDTIRSRMAFLELRRFRDRPNHPPASPEQLQKMIAEAGDLSAGIRARALATYDDLFCVNLELARQKILEMGGGPRDAATLGHLIAGWATATADHKLTEDEIGKLERFRPFIQSIADEEDGEDDASRLFNTLLGLPMPFYRGGAQLTVGQVIARARMPDDHQARSALLPVGLRLERIRSQANDRVEPWPEAWLAIANNHATLDSLFKDYPEFQGKRRAQILKDLKRTIDGVVHEVKPSDGALRFAGPQSRAWLVPAKMLPDFRDEQQEEPKPAPPLPPDRDGSGSPA